MCLLSDFLSATFVVRLDNIFILSVESDSFSSVTSSSTTRAQAWVPLSSSEGESSSERGESSSYRYSRERSWWRHLHRVAKHVSPNQTHPRRLPLNTRRTTRNRGASTTIPTTVASSKSSRLCPNPHCVADHKSHHELAG
jgi:hypothetical protein